MATATGNTFNRDGEFVRRALHRLHPTVGPSHTSTLVLAILLGGFDGILLGPLTLNLGVPATPEALQYIAGMVLGACIGVLAHTVGSIVAEYAYWLDGRRWYHHAESWMAIGGGVVLVGSAFAAGHLRADDSNTSELVLDFFQLLFVAAGVLLGFCSGDPNKAKAEQIDHEVEAATDVVEDAKGDVADAVDATAEAASDTIEAGMEFVRMRQQLFAGVGQRKAIATSKAYRYEGALYPAAHSLADAGGDLADQLKQALQGDHLDRQVVSRAFDEAGITDLCRELADFEAKVVLPVLTGVGAWAQATSVDIGDELKVLATKIEGFTAPQEREVPPDENEVLDLTDVDGDDGDGGDDDDESLDADTEDPETDHVATDEDSDQEAAEGARTSSNGSRT